MPRCPKCERDDVHFNKNRRTKTGLQSYCRDCMAHYLRHPVGKEQDKRRCRRPAKNPICLKCGCKDRKNFWKHSRRKSGFQAYCKACQKNLARLHRPASTRRPLSEWEAILKAERLTMERAASLAGKSLMYEHKVADDFILHGYQSPLEMEVYAGIHGTSAEWYREVRAKVDGWNSFK